MKNRFSRKDKRIKTLVIVLEFLFVFLLAYLVLLPAYPELKYKFSSQSNKVKDSKDVVKVTEEVEEVKRHLPTTKYSVSQNRVIIPKIGVNAPISQADNEKEGLALGAWLVPVGSTPDKDGNTIITGHRFKYLPPSNLTFYLFHKLEKDDVFSVIWEGEDYFYKVKEISIVDASESWPHAPSSDNILTMYTCHPIYSTEKRLVIVSEPIEN